MDRNRVGGKVRGNYKRFVFESAEEALEMKERFAKHQSRGTAGSVTT